MSDWAEAEKRVEEMKPVDPKGADKLYKEITAVCKLHWFWHWSVISQLFAY